MVTVKSEQRFVFVRFSVRVAAFSCTGQRSQHGADRFRGFFPGSSQHRRIAVHAREVSDGSEARDLAEFGDDCHIIIADAFTHAGARAVADTVKELTGLEAVFKIPNDVLIRGKKIAGVLAETGYRGNEPEWAVFGIGCNVNALPEDFPESVRHKVTSILAENGGPVARAKLLAALLKNLETAYTSLREKAFLRKR